MYGSYRADQQHIHSVRQAGRQTDKVHFPSNEFCFIVLKSDPFQGPLLFKRKKHRNFTINTLAATSHVFMHPHVTLRPRRTI